MKKIFKIFIVTIILTMALSAAGCQKTLTPEEDYDFTMTNILGEDYTDFTEDEINYIVDEIAAQNINEMTPEEYRTMVEQIKEDVRKQRK